MFNSILEYAQQHDCSDIHLVAQDFPIVREVGEIKRLDWEIIPKETLYEWIRNLLSDTQWQSYQEGHDVDLSYSDSNSNRYRLNVYSQRGLPALTMRLLNNEIPTIDGMKLPPILKQLTNEPRGLVLVTGPTGSGKSTTLAAMVNEINIHHSKHIITLEYPIEYLHSQKKSLINQREIHFDTKSFSAALL